jgi:serine/threonine-protein kinase
VKLLDFGISKNVAPTRAPNDLALTADREMMGSPRYMSPEQVRSSKDVDTRTDIWSLGVILHELLAGAPPFYAENVADTFVAVLHAAPSPIARTAPDVPPELVEIVMRCLQKDREHRFATVEELSAALMPFRSVDPLLVAPLPERLDDLSRTAEPGGSVRTLHSLPRTRGLVTASLTFGAIGLVAVIVVLSTRLRPPSPLPSPSTRVQAAPLALEEASAPPLAASLAAVASVTPIPSVTSPAEIPDAPSATRPVATPPRGKPAAITTPRHRTDW